MSIYSATSKKDGSIYYVKTNESKTGKVGSYTFHSYLDKSGKRVKVTYKLMYYNGFFPVSEFTFRKLKRKSLSV